MLCLLYSYQQCIFQFVAANIAHSSPPPFHSFPPVSSVLSPPPPMDLELPTSTYMPTSPCLAASSLTSWSSTYCQQPPCSSLLHTLCHMHECRQLCLMNYGHYSFGLLRLAPSCSASACRCTVMLYTVCSMYAECGWPKRKFMLIPSYANMLS